jgi:hypothetical protein
LYCYHHILVPRACALVAHKCVLQDRLYQRRLAKRRISKKEFMNYIDLKQTKLLCLNVTTHMQNYISWQEIKFNYKGGRSVGWQHPRQHPAFQILQNVRAQLIQNCGKSRSHTAIRSQVIGENKIHSHLLNKRWFPLSFIRTPE